jgi:hypothetical protein
MAVLSLIVPGAVAAVVAVVLVLKATSYAPAVSPDSIIYLEASRNLVDGLGLQYAGRPLRHYPPGYPVLLAVLQYAGCEALAAARFLNIVLAAGIVAIMGWIAFKGTNGSLVACSVVAGFSVVSPPVFELYVSAWSEAPFILFMLIAFVCLARYVETRRTGLLIVSGLAAGAALLMRYAGISIIPVLLLPLLIGGGEAPRRSVRDAAILLTLSIAPIGLVMAGNHEGSGIMANRTLSFHPVSSGHLVEAAASISRFWYPLNLPTGSRAVLSLVTVIAVGVALARGTRHHLSGFRSGRPGAALWLLFLAFLVIYPSFLAVSISLVDFATPLDTRILSPLFYPALYIVVVGCWKATTGSGRGERWRWLATMLGGLLCLHIWVTWKEAVARQESGVGYASRAWRESPTLLRLLESDEERQVVSNAPEAIRFLSDRSARMMPRFRVQAYGQELNSEYGREMERLGECLASGDCYLVVFEWIDRPYLQTARELERDFDLPVAARLEDGVIYGRP